MALCYLFENFKLPLNQQTKVMASLKFIEFVSVFIVCYLATPSIAAIM